MNRSLRRVAKTLAWNLHRREGDDEGAAMNRNQRVVILFGLLLISAIVLGCASNSRIETAASSEAELERARRLALEAELDADLAVAIKNNRDTQALVTEIRSSLQTLDDELRRGESSDRSAR
jgi:hypothetical protein